MNKLLTREKLNELFGIPTKHETEPYNDMKIRTLLWSQQNKHQIWWCEKCNDFHTSFCNCIKAIRYFDDYEPDEKTIQLIKLLNNMTKKRRNELIQEQQDLVNKFMLKQEKEVLI